MSGRSTSMRHASTRSRSTGRWCSALGALAASTGSGCTGARSASWRTTASHFNTSVLFAPDGTLMAGYRKVHLFGFDGGETVLMSGGDELFVVETPLGPTGSGDLLRPAVPGAVPGAHRRRGHGLPADVRLAHAAHRALGHPHARPGDREPGLVRGLQRGRRAARASSSAGTPSSSTRRARSWRQAGTDGGGPRRRRGPGGQRAVARASSRCSPTSRSADPSLSVQRGPGRVGPNDVHTQRGHMRVMTDSGPTTMTGLRSGSSQRSTSRICRCGIAMQPAVTLPFVTCRKMPPPALVSAGVGGAPDAVGAGADRVRRAGCSPGRRRSCTAGRTTTGARRTRRSRPSQRARSGRRCRSPAGGVVGPGVVAVEPAVRQLGPGSASRPKARGIAKVPAGVLPVPCRRWSARYSPLQPRRAGVAPTTSRQPPSPSRSYARSVAVVERQEGAVTTMTCPAVPTLASRDGWYGGCSGDALPAPARPSGSQP